MKDVYTFPAIFNYASDGISIKFPDLPGCFSCADNNDEAAYMAADALALRLYSDEQDGIAIPEPTDVLTLKSALEMNQIVMLVSVDMKKIRAEHANKAVNKMVTLPQWLINEGKEAGINFSQTLQDALMTKLGISREIKRRKSKFKQLA